jgi:hypothetical protein
MRFVVVMVLAALVASPRSVSAQTGEEGEASEPNVVEAVPTHDSASQDATLQLTLDDDGVEVAPGYPPRLDEMELRARRAKIGLGVAAGFLALGIGLTIGAGVCDSRNPAPEESFSPTSAHCSALFVVAPLVTIGSLIAMIVKGVHLAKRKGELRELQQAHYGKPRRVQWDLARSRLVF